ncbi:dienelactone hydrolase [Inhella inkyongensis]|uniref:Dienelactone hydrolase n=1 Tax=Inhella inkyongensis TaxID=392593 RepID=A0A840S729_9BURK|nr:acetylxylan esterase [Inhella inkyongensis]MBB5204806.1 dienelactone hydrolase [Inhella inkyongensis]
MGGALGLAGLLGVLWWSLFGLKPYDISPAELQARYALPAPAPLRVERRAGDGHSEELVLHSFDGSQAVGRIVYPSDPAIATQPFPLLIGLHAMGRAHQRWWSESFKGRPTLEQTHRITEAALAQGYAVMAIDARLHGLRKDAKGPASKLMWDLHLWGAREPYERMLIDTVRDHRLLLDWVLTQPSRFDARRIAVAGYSMGGQLALLWGGLDARIRAIAAIVPPHVDDKVAAVSPQRLLAGLADKRVWLLTADDDEHASAAQNQALYEALPTADKKHLRFAGNHLLPPSYVAQLQGWLP